MRKIALGFVVVTALGFGVFKLRPKTVTTKVTPSTNPQTSTKAEADQSVPQTVRLIATGDFIAHDAINAAAKNPGGSYDYAPMMARMKPIFAKADLKFCNQATPAGGVGLGISGFPVFNAPLEWTRDMANLGCNVVNIGSNHSNDKGQSVIDATRAGWDSRPGVLAVAGANRSSEEQKSIGYFSTKSLKFAFLSYVTYSNTKDMTSYGVNMFSRAVAADQLKEARSKADVVIVSMRWGTEYSPTINAEQTADGQFLADNGADIVFGHGPHVIEPVNVLAGQGGRSTWVWYSLGNFLNAQLQTESLFSGLPVIDIDTSSKQIKTVRYLPIYMHYLWTPAQAAAQDLLARHDFELYTLDDAAAPLAASQLKTTVEAQRTRIESTLNTYTKLPIMSSKDL